MVAALISFDLQRMMGKWSVNKYDIMAGGFASSLHEKLNKIKPNLLHLTQVHLTDINLQCEKVNIADVYRELSAGGGGGLNQKRGKLFHVGASKIMHFINPELFLIVDSNAARAFKRSHGISYANTTQPRYTPEKYLSCMSCAKADIIAFGLDKFCSLEPGTPIARIYDKLTFVTGSDPPLTCHLT